MSDIAIITARGGSKRIPGKNIRDFCGKPILEYSIEAALGSGCFSKVMISTDDEAIAEVAKHAGAEVPFYRSAETSDDFATTDMVIAEVLAEYEKRGESFDAFCCIYPTAPFISPGRLQEAMALLREHEAMMPVVAFSYPPQRSFIIDGGKLVRKYPEYANARSQDLEKLYHDCGQFYACRVDAFLRGGTMNVEDRVPLILPESEVQDIDTEEDWIIAEEKYRRLKR
ncbi:MAG: pseudaminic acid cytidylyltransferase [Lachnospiraceae bacterium]|nr:pseudaminic acid cytidylyltransferase [Lachnospiraceae bacterium]